MRIRKRITLIHLIILFCFIFIINTPKAHAWNQSDYMPGELIVKLKQISDTGRVDSDRAYLKPFAKKDSQIPTGSTLDGLISKHNVKSIEKIIKNGRGLKETAINALNPLQSQHGIDRLYLLKLNENEDINNALRDFRNDPNVEYAEPNYIVYTTLIPNDPNFANLWGLHNTGQTGGKADADIDAPEAWNMKTNSNDVVVAVIDTGVDYSHEDLAGNIWNNANEIPENNIDDDGNGFIDDVRGWDFYNNDNNPADDGGHGTHVSGTIGAVGDNGKGIAGVNWNVKIMPIKFISYFGSGTEADAIKSINYARLMNVDIMSNSWGGTKFSQGLKDAISAANDANILFVAAAGNFGKNSDLTPLYPAAFDNENIISVAATDHNDNLAGFSNYGAVSVDLGAPGVSIFSTVPTGNCSLCDPTGYKYLSGTSMATPHVSGAATLIKSKFPSLTYLQIKARLLNSAEHLKGLEGKSVSEGRLNAFNALEDDIIAPGAITDLSAANISLTSVALQWTATGDDGSAGTASRYDLRYSQSPIDAISFESATKVANLTKPKPAGSAESFRVTGLYSSTAYYFALRAEDNVGNSGQISNMASATTKEPKILFMDNFESGADGWSTEGTSSTNSSNFSWHLETLKYNSPTTSWTYNSGAPSYYYYTGTSRNFGTLTSPSINLTGQINPALRFYEFYETETGKDHDQRWVKISSNGKNFTNLVQLSNDTMSTWHKHEIDLSQYKGNVIKIGFYFDTIDSVLNNFWGWSIDDMSILVENNANNSIQGDVPVANADGPYFGIEDTILMLNGSGSFDPNGGNLIYNWNFGDGTLEMETVGPFVKHNYTFGGTYIVKLIVNNGIADSEPYATIANITEINDAPVADAGPDRNVNAGSLVIFNGSNSSDEEGPIASYNWNFGDNSTAYGPIVNHTYIFPGIYYAVLTVSDGQLDSSDAALVKVASLPSADLKITSLSTATRAIAPGNSLYLSNTVKNAGNANAGPFAAGFALSSDQAYSTDDINFSATRKIASLANGSSSTASTYLLVPASVQLGNYYLCSFADINNSVNEQNETNNGLCTTAAVKVTRPDLIMAEISPLADTAIGGKNLSLVSTIKNNGEIAARNSYVSFRLSTNNIYGDSDDIAVSTLRLAPALQADAFSQNVTNILIPISVKAGNYYVCAKADSTNLVIEINETNNAICSNTTITLPPPDLIISNLSTAISAVAPGRAFYLSNSAKNSGSSASGPSNISFHLSVDQNYGGLDDVAIQNYRTVNPLNPGAISTTSTYLVVPYSAPLGNYYICAFADSNNSVFEGLNEDNNFLCTNSRVEITRPDLLITMVNGPSNATKGTYISVENSVYNQGKVPSTGFYVGIYLSTDANINASDRFLKNRYISGLTALSTNTSSTILLIPVNIANGNYYLGAIADYSKYLMETDETNNALRGNSIIIN
ncbi:S8 family serine peptidase [Candidatus Woesearchaeota archaeon]|nr:S8 family serine peptidase [Candidatus Woesearchaeota archaeon]